MKMSQPCPTEDDGEIFADPPKNIIVSKIFLLLRSGKMLRRLLQKMAIRPKRP